MLYKNCYHPRSSESKYNLRDPSISRMNTVLTTFYRTPLAKAIIMPASQDIANAVGFILPLPQRGTCHDVAVPRLLLPAAWPFGLWQCSSGWTKSQPGI